MAIEIPVLTLTIMTSLAAEVYDCSGTSKRFCSVWIMHNAKCVICVALLVATLPKFSFSEPPETFAHALKRHHIQITQTALIEALQNPDKEVRGLAAAELAEMKVSDALPYIIQAAQDERDPQTQVNIAAAASWLGSAEGLTMLRSVCRDSNLSAYLRLDAISNVFFARDHSCFPELVEMMQQTSETDVRIGALSLASQIEQKTENESNVVLSVALEALKDQDLRIRLYASEALRWMNATTAIPALRRAIGQETEDVVRQQMESDLKFLLEGRCEH